MSPFNPAQPHRRSIRLPKYDYTQPGAYFVTFVTHARELLFEDAARRRIVETALQQIPRHCPNIQLDEWSSPRRRGLKATIPQAPAFLSKTDHPISETQHTFIKTKCFV